MRWDEVGSIPPGGTPINNLVGGVLDDPAERDFAESTITLL
jgi:hypothetical protein